MRNAAIESGVSFSFRIYPAVRPVRVIAPAALLQASGGVDACRTLRLNDHLEIYETRLLPIHGLVPTEDRSLLVATSVSLPQAVHSRRVGRKFGEGDLLASQYGTIFRGKDDGIPGRL
jgi:hypothetical protein